MSYVRVLLLTTALIAGGCAAPPKPADTSTQDSKALGERISRICALPDAQREAELEKMKNETGMVLYCGK